MSSNSGGSNENRSTLDPLCYGNFPFLNSLHPLVSILDQHAKFDQICSSFLNHAAHNQVLALNSSLFYYIWDIFSSSHFWWDDPTREFFKWQLFPLHFPFPTPRLALVCGSMLSYYAVRCFSLNAGCLEPGSEVAMSCMKRIQLLCSLSISFISCPSIIDLVRTSMLFYCAVHSLSLNAGCNQPLNKPGSEVPMWCMSSPLLHGLSPLPCCVEFVLLCIGMLFCCAVCSISLDFGCREPGSDVSAYCISGLLFLCSLVILQALPYSSLSWWWHEVCLSPLLSPFS